MSHNTSIPATAPAPSLVTVTHVVYALHSLSLLIGVTTAASIEVALTLPSRRMSA